MMLNYKSNDVYISLFKKILQHCCIIFVKLGVNISYPFGNSPYNVVISTFIQQKIQQEQMQYKGGTFKPRTRSKPRAHFDARVHTNTHTNIIINNDSSHRAKEIQKRTQQSIG